MSFDIIGTGNFTPTKVIHNNDLSEFLDTSDEWILSRTGIKNRHIMTDETITEMAVKASMNAINQSGISIDEIDLIICSTIQGDFLTPSLACLVQKEIGATCPAFDINAACSGFIYALDLADAYFSRENINTILVVAAESMSQVVNWSDRETCVLFGDGSGAAILQKGNSLMSIMLSAQGKVDPLNIPGNIGNSPFSNRTQPEVFLKMSGQEIFRFAVTALSKNLQVAAEKAGINISEIDWIIPHQANTRLITSAANQLKLPLTKFLINIHEYGNTSSASIPIMLDEASRDGRIQPGQIIAMVAFGGGLTTGACILKWK